MGGTVTLPTICVKVAINGVWEIGNKIVEQLYVIFISMNSYVAYLMLPWASGITAAILNRKEQQSQKLDR